MKFNGSIEGQKSVKGILKEVNDDFIVVESDKEFKITNDKIKCANLEGEL